MLIKAILAGTMVMMVAPLAAQEAAGDADAGEASFSRNCVVCHVVKDENGEVLAGRNAETGPNLYGVVGAKPGSQHDFPYSASLVEYGETGATWGEDNMVSFMQNPTGHLREALDDPRARSNMAYQLRNEDAARDVYAFLAEFAAGTSDEAASDETADAASPDIAAGESIYQGACRTCHGPKAQGLASFPKLAGKDAAHLVARLEQYRAGEMVGSNSALMIPHARDLSDEDIANVAGYISMTFD